MSFTNIDDPSAHFQVATWTGDGSTSDRNITNDGNSDLAPDFIWGACRTDVQHKHLTDSSRGFSTGNKELISSGSNQEGDTGAVNTGAYGWLGPSITDGFESSYGSVNNGYWNVNARTYVAWQWKAAGGTTVSNSEGSITSTVQANTTAGFSIITYTGTGGGETFGHGLGVAPDMWIIKRRDGTGSWAVGFNDANILGGTSKYLILQGASSVSTYSNFWGTSPASSTVMRIAGDATIGGSSNTYVAYAFAQKQGYSAFGSYIGSGARSSAPFIYTGFKPRFLISKNVTGSGSWSMWDTKRNPVNGDTDYLIANGTDAESGSGFGLNDPFYFYSNGFGVMNADGWSNAVNQTYIYIAFAENPFVTSTGIPTTAF